MDITPLIFNKNERLREAKTMIKLANNEQPKSICVSDMIDGDIGVVVTWSSDDDMYLGQIVQRYKDDLIVVGERSGKGWGNIFSKGQPRMSNCYVRLLEKGETLIVE